MSAREVARAKREVLPLAEHSWAALVTISPTRCSPLDWLLLLPRLPTSCRRSLSNKKENSPPLPPQLGVHGSLGGCRSGTKRSPRCCQSDSPRAAACRVQAPAADTGASQARSPKRKWSTSAGRKGSKGLKHTPFPPLFTGSSTRCTHKPEGCTLASAAGSCLPHSVRWERSKHCLPSWSHLSYGSTPWCLRWDPAPLFPWGCRPWKQAHSPQMLVARCLQLSSLGHPCASVPWGLRTPGFCPCAPCPGHHPGSAGPEEESTRQLQVSLASLQLERMTSSR